MPHVIVKLAAGRTRDQKVGIAAEVTRAIMQSAGVGEEAVSVSIEDVEPKAWAEQVYRPQIAGRPDTLIKKPGYGPL